MRGDIWVTRTQPGASSMADLLQQHGYRVWCASVLRIERFDQWRCESPDWWPSPQVIVVISTHAASAYLQSIAADQIEVSPQTVHVAIGSATANILAQAQITALVPTQSDSEGVLAMPLWRSLDRRSTVWILGGVGGRDLLEQQLQTRAKVSKLALYERVACKVEGLQPHRIDGIVVASGDGLSAVAEQWFQANGRADVALLVPSERVAKMAMELGFVRVHNAASAAPESVLGVLQELDTL